MLSFIAGMMVNGVLVVIANMYHCSVFFSSYTYWGLVFMVLMLAGGYYTISIIACWVMFVMLSVIAAVPIYLTSWAYPIFAEGYFCNES